MQTYSLSDQRFRTKNLMYPVQHKSRGRFIGPSYLSEFVTIPYKIKRIVYMVFLRNEPEIVVWSHFKYPVEFWIQTIDTIFIYVLCLPTAEIAYAQIYEKSKYLRNSIFQPPNTSNKPTLIFTVHFKSAAKYRVYHHKKKKFGTYHFTETSIYQTILRP